MIITSKKEITISKKDLYKYIEEKLNINLSNTTVLKLQVSIKPGTENLEHISIEYREMKENLK